MSQTATESRIHVVTAVGTQQQQGHACNLPGQGMQKLQATVVAPMHVLYDQQQWTLPCLPGEEVRQGGKEAALLLLGVQWEQRGKARQLREQGDALRE